jgi:DNA helicase-2/ATP-dependent DNA helicase PcrA
VPVPPQDPQPQANPTPEGAGVEIVRPPNLEASLDAIRQRVRQIFQHDRDFQGAILVRENRQGQFLAEQLRDLENELGLRVYEVGEQNRNSQVPQDMQALLQFLQRPHSPDYLKAALTVLSDRHLIPSQDFNRLATYPEAFLYPTALEPPLAEPLRHAQRLCTQLLRARQELPPTDLIAFLGLSLRYEQGELATADKLADHCRQRLGTDLSLQGILTTLQDLLNTEKFESVDPQALESVYTAPKQLTIITMHKAKGLDWNYVFLPFLHAKSLPGSLWVPNQAEFLGNFTLSAITRSLLRHVLHQTLPDSPGDVSPTFLDPQTAWQEADYLKRSEEYRLLYVAMTRAKRLLWMAAEQEAPLSWNNPDRRKEADPTPIVPVLQQYFQPSSKFK